ncbi:LysR substrate-binding domain-containing protein [Methylosinus sp. LW4]|uniref:LysR substrate-binding domain-containing protein n=1 Tax=Methylosinus sp. LW4 TaxID=136993 RepID=UPI0003A479E4|nr:LysR substrate-binding domain-containing protein [Methylosinus sp. LW4]
MNEQLASSALNSRDIEDLSDFLLFAAIVERGGIAGASRSLCIPKSRLSRRLAALEERYAVQLIHRSSRRFVVTDLGQSFYERCRDTLASSQATKAFIVQAQSRPRGALRVSAPAPLANYWLAPILPKFLARHPEISLELDARNWNVDLMADRIDLAIRIRPTPLDDSDLIIRRIGESRNILVASPGLPALDALHSPDDLPGYPLLGAPPAQGPSIWRLWHADGRIHVIPVDPRLATCELAVLRAASEAGLGIALLPAHFCQRQLDDGRLAIVLPEWAGPINDIHIAYLSRRGLSAAARALLDFLIDELPHGDRA